MATLATAARISHHAAVLRRGGTLSPSPLRRFPPAFAQAGGSAPEPECKPGCSAAAPQKDCLFECGSDCAARSAASSEGATPPQHLHATAPLPRAALWLVRPVP